MIKGACDPVAIQTKLGWVLSGPAQPEETIHVLKIEAQPTSNDDLESQLRSFWDLESLGIVREERTLYDDFFDTVTLREGRYEVALPWRAQHRPLPDNLLLSNNRLISLLQRLRQTPGEEMAHDSPSDASVSYSHSPTYQNHCPAVPQDKSSGSSNNQHPSRRAAMQARDKILSQSLQDELMDY